MYAVKFMIFDEVEASCQELLAVCGKRSKDVGLGIEEGHMSCG